MQQKYGKAKVLYLNLNNQTDIVSVMSFDKLIRNRYVNFKENKFNLLYIYKQTT